MDWYCKSTIYGTQDTKARHMLISKILENISLWCVVLVFCQVLILSEWITASATPLDGARGADSVPDADRGQEPDRQNRNGRDIDGAWIDG